MSAKHRSTILLAAAVLFVLALALGAGVGFETDVMRLLPRSDRVVGDYLEVLERFRSLDSVLIDVYRPDAPFDPATVRAAQGLTARLEDSELVSRVKGRVGFEELAAGFDLLHAHRANLFSEEVADAAEELLTEERIGERLDDVRRQLLNFPDPVTARLFESDPFGMDPLFFALLPSPSGGGAQVVDGWLWSEDGQHLLLFAEPVSADLDSARSAALEHDMEQAIAEVSGRGDAGGGVEVARLSRYRAALDNERTVRGDIARTLWISLAGVALVLVSTLGWSRRLPILFLPPLFGGAVAMGALAVVFGRVSPVVVGCGSILLGISIDYAIHLVFRLQYTAAGLETREEAAASTARPIFLASMTTGIAFLSLLASALPGHKQLGVFAASGVIAAAACTLLVLPLLLPRGAGAALPRAALPIAAATARVLEALRSRRLPVAVVAAVLLAAAVPGVLRLEVETDLERFNALGPEALRDSRRIGEVWGSTMGQTSVAVRGRTMDEALSAGITVGEMLANERAAGTVADVQSIAGLLPDRATQAANRERWQRFWSEDRAAGFRAVLEQAMRSRGFAPKAVASFWDSLPIEVGPLVLEDLAGTPLARILEGWVAAGEGGEAWVLTRCTLAEETDFDGLAERLRTAVPGALVSDGRQMVQRLSTMTYRELQKMSLLSFVLVLGFLLPFSRNVRQPMALAAVLLVTFVWSLGVLGWLGIPITMMNSLIAIFVFGLTIDYAIFLLHAVAEGGERSAVISAAVVVSSMTTLVGFGALLLARHPSLSSIGVTTVVGIICGLAASMMVVPVVAAPPEKPEERVVHRIGGPPRRA